MLFRSSTDDLVRSGIWRSECLVRQPEEPERDTPADPGQERIGAAGSGVRKVVDSRALKYAAAVAEDEERPAQESRGESRNGAILHIESGERCDWACAGGHPARSIAGFDIAGWVRGSEQTGAAWRRARPSGMS